MGYSMSKSLYKNCTRRLVAVDFTRFGFDGTTVWLGHMGRTTYSKFQFNKKFNSEQEKQEYIEKFRQGYCITCGNVKNCIEYYKKFE